MTNQALIQFNPKLPRLSASEKAALKLLIEAGKLIAPIYEEQEKNASKVSKQQIEKLAKKDPEFSSPYTVVEQVKGKLIATPYHLKYKEFLEPVAEKLNKAANTIDNKEFAKFLKLQAKALLDGSYEQATAARIQMAPYILDVLIGPFEYHSVQLLYSKASYQAWIGVIDTEGTKRLHNYKATIHNVRKSALIPADRVENFNKVKVKVIDVLLFSGLMARTKFVGVNLPIDVNFVEKYGSEITLFNQPNDFRMQQQIIPTFNKIFLKEFRQGFSHEDLRRASLRYIAMHELAHSYLYYRNAAKNLEDLFRVIYELAATILGLRMAGFLLLKDSITNKQMESMIVAYLSRSFYLIENSKTNTVMNDYILGSKIFVNFMHESGSLKELGEIAIPNFMKIFVSLHDLSNILERLLSSGTKKEAEYFIRKYSKEV